MQNQLFSTSSYSLENSYPFGMVMPGRSFTSSGGDYRFGFNGMEDNSELTDVPGSHLDFGARIYDSRLGKFFSLDPMSNKFPSESNYSFAGNSPIALVDIEGKFKFSPQTLVLLKEQYPTAYKYLVETVMDKSGNILELTKSDKVVNAIIKNTDYYAANQKREIALSGGANTLTLSDVGVLQQEGSQKLSKEDIVSAFSEGGGQEIIITDNPGGVIDGGGSFGFNEGNDGKNYSSPIYLNTSLFENIENAANLEDKQAALLDLTSTIIHEYIEDFANDGSNIPGDHGARAAQWEMYGDLPNEMSAKPTTGIIDNIKINGDDSVLPTLPEE